MTTPAWSAASGPGRSARPRARGRVEVGQPSPGEHNGRQSPSGVWPEASPRSDEAAAWRPPRPPPAPSRVAGRTAWCRRRSAARRRGARAGRPSPARRRAGRRPRPPAVVPGGAWRPADRRCVAHSGRGARHPGPPPAPVRGSGGGPRRPRPSAVGRSRSAWVVAQVVACQRWRLSWRRVTAPLGWGAT